MTSVSKQKKANNVRPPVVSVLGHIDHGKTTLLDYIKKSKIADQEAGGITQHVTAYEISHQDSKITFVDTPGHEAFAKMRSRGAKVADIALLVVSSVEGVRVQTEEALKYIREAEIPFVVVASKVDFEDKNIEKLKSELNELGVELEEWGGDVPFVKTSTKTGEGIEELLDVVMLLAELSDLKERKSDPFYAVVIESHLSDKRGAVCTVIVKSGTLEKSEGVFANGNETTVKRLEDFRGQSMKKAFPSQPVTILGFKDLPPVGGIMRKQSEKDIELSKVIFEDSGQHQAGAGKGKEEDRGRIIGPEDCSRELNLIVKTDVQGTAEALLDFIETLNPEETKIKIAKISTGPISEEDVRLASAMKGGVLGFRVDTPKQIQKLAERENVPVGTCDVIYDVEEILKDHLSQIFSAKSKKIKKGEVKILKKFTEREGGRSIVGGKVTKGVVEDGDSVIVVRGGEKQGEGTVANLQREKKAAETIKKGSKCGIMFKGSPQVDKGDALQVYRLEKTLPSL